MSFDLKDPEVKKAFDAAIAEQLESVKAEAEEAVNKLRDNNKKLLADLREARKSREINPEEHQKLEEQVSTLSEQLKAAQDDGKKLQTTLGKTVEELTAKLQSETGYTQKLLVDNGLSDALVKAGVDTPFLPAVKAMLSGQVKIVADGDARKAVVGEKQLAEFVSGWAQSDEGKVYVKAPVNGGGGSNGGAPNAGGVTVINASDKAGMQKHLADIATGKVKVNLDA